MKQYTLSEPIFIGREHELNDLIKCLDSAFSGKGNTIFLIGEAGSGKSRLVNEFISKAQEKNAITIAGSCLSNAAIPFFPFIEAFRHSSKNMGKMFSSDPFQTIGTSTLEGSRRFSGNVQTFAPQAWMDQVFESIVSELVYLSAKKPTILVLEDMHWADSASLALLHYISRAIRTERVFVLATFRKEELNSDMTGQPLPLLKTLRLMGRESLYDKIELSNLNVHQVSEMAKSILGKELDQGLIEKLFSESQGNPLFVVESLAMLFSDGCLTQKNGRYALSIDKFHTPLKIRDIILCRLGKLKIKYRRILEIASVIGENFDSSLIGAVVGQDNLQILEKLDLIAQSTSLIRCVDNYYRFDHAKTREIIYDAIAAPLKIGYHAKIAQRLEGVINGYREFRVSDLAYHYKKAGNKAKSLEYSLAAGNDALLRYSNAEAIKHFTYVLENSLDGEQNQMMAIEGVGDALLAEGRFVESAKLYSQLYGSESGLVRLRAIRKSIHATFLQGNIAYSAEQLRKAEDYSHFDPLEYARVRSSVGWAMGFRGNINEAINYLEEALNVFEEANSISDMAEVLYNLSELYVTKGHIYDAISAAQRSLAFYGEIGNIRGQMESSFRAGHVFFNCGEYDEAWACYSKTAEIGDKIGDYNRAAWATSYLSWISESKGNLEEALAQIKKTQNYAQKTDSYYAQSIVYASFVRLYSKLGDLDAANKYYDKLLAIHPTISSSASKLSHVVIVRSEAVLYAARGEEKRAFASFEESLRLLSGSLFESLTEAQIRADYAWALQKNGLLSDAQYQINKVKEYAANLENKFNHSKVQAFLVAQRVGNGKEVNVRLDLVNVSKTSVMLLNAQGLVPSPFVLSKLPKSYCFENGILDLRETRIPPFNVLSIKFTLTASKNAVLSSNQIIFVSDALGKNQTIKPIFSNYAAKAVNDHVGIAESGNGHEAQHINLESELSREAFDFLVRSFVEDYIKKRMVLEQSGWKTLSEISKHAVIPLHFIYGRNGRFGKATVELERKGLIEKRFYKGQRGRGGKILRVRVNYEKDIIKKEIDAILAKSTAKSPLYEF